jgi:hypothetical protein
LIFLKRTKRRLNADIRACLKIEENDGFLPKTVNFKEKTQSNRRLRRLIDAEDDRFGAKRRRFRFFKQAIVLWCNGL